MAVEQTQIAALSALIRELGLSTTALSPILAHARAVQNDAHRLGLVASSDLGTVVARHSADSLLFAVVREPLPGERWVDVGSGAGFPGLVLACTYPETMFVLVEPQRRRAGFLDLQCARLGLVNASVSGARANDLTPGFDVAVARALAEPALALELLHSLAPDGTALLAVGDSAHAIQGVDDIDAARPGVDSPGRFFMIAATQGGA